MTGFHRGDTRIIDTEYGRPMEAFTRRFSRDAVSRDTRSAYLDNDTFPTKTMDES